MATSRATLLSDPTSSLARMFQEDSEMPPAKLKDGEFFLDLDPKCFEVVKEPVDTHIKETYDKMSFESKKKRAEIKLLKKSMNM